MKNIFKLFALIAGLSLCMMESPEQAMTTIKVNFVSGNALVELQVPVSQGTFTKSDLMTAFEQDQERTNPTELGKVMDAHSLLIGNKIASECPDDAQFPIDEVVQVVRSGQKVTLPFGGIGPNKKSLVTLYGDLNSPIEKISEEDQNTVKKYIDYYSPQGKTKTCWWSLFWYNDRNQYALKLMSSCIQKVEVAGVVFKSEPDRSELGPKYPNNLKYLFTSLDTCQAGQITQAQLDKNDDDGIQAWVVLATD